MSSDERFERLRRLIKKEGLEAVAIVPGPNMRYLTGADFHLMERPLILFVPPLGTPVLVIPALEVPKWEETGVDAIVHAWRDDEGPEKAFTMVANTFRKMVIGVESLRMRVLEGQIIEEITRGSVVPADNVFVDLRIVKQPDEVDKHRRAVEISERALRNLIDNLQLGMRERDIARMLSQIQRDLGGGDDSFTPLVLIGPRTALPHGVPGDTPLQEGDALLIDFGTTYEGYVSDITRTFFVGEASSDARSLYEAVLAANTAGREAIRPGIMAGRIDDIASQKLRTAGFGDYILHRTGHGLGIDIHEHPNINTGNDVILSPGMVFTIEPGLYVDGHLGVRIEDNVVVTDDGYESLSKFPRELMVLDLS